MEEEKGLEPGWIDIDDGIELPGNPKDHDLGAIHEAYSEFGYLERGLVNRETGHLIAGHGRRDTLRQARAMGYAAPKNVRVDGGKWYMPGDFCSLDERDEMRAALALNKLSEAGGWNEPLLAGALKDLVAEGEEMLRGTGFEIDEAERIIREMEEGIARDTPEVGETAFGREEELQEKWGVVSGDIWRVGKNLIVCGDCRERGIIDGLIENGMYRGYKGVFTSPPYAEQRDGQYGGIPEGEYIDWWEKVQGNVRRYLDRDGSFFVNIKAHVSDSERSLYVMDLVTAMARKWGWSFVDEFCWLRPPFMGRVYYNFKNGFEPVYHFANLKKGFAFYPEQVMVDSLAVPVKDDEDSRYGRSLPEMMGNQGWVLGEQHYEAGKAYPSNVLKAFQNKRVLGHAASFPVDLPRFFISAYSKEGDVWLDPFVGSGTTILAAHETGRVGIGIEIRPGYVAIALERLREAVGEDPIRIANVAG